MFFIGLKRTLFILVIVFIALVSLLRYGYVESAAFPDRTLMPLLASTELEVVADLVLPPGNIAVADNADVYFTFHPEAKPSINLARLVNGQAQAFPSTEWQPGGSEPLAFNEVLSIRIDNQQRLWALDNGKHGLERARLLAFDLAQGELVDSFTFSRAEFALGSHANDFQISKDGRYIIISDASLLAKNPALIIYDTQQKTARRVLERHESVLAGPFEPVVQGKKMTLFGIFTVNPGVDGLVLDASDEFLYYASVSANQLYRVPFSALINDELSATALAGEVETVAEKTMTDGMVMDSAGNLYLSDIENSAIVRINPQGQLDTLLKSVSIRWPDGFSNGPNNYVYFTASSLHEVLGKSAEHIAAQGPYQIFRFKLPSSDLTSSDLTSSDSTSGDI